MIEENNNKRSTIFDIWKQKIKAKKTLKTTTDRASYIKKFNLRVLISSACVISLTSGLGFGLMETPEIDTALQIFESDTIIPGVIQEDDFVLLNYQFDQDQSSVPEAIFRNRLVDLGVDDSYIVEKGETGTIDALKAVKEGEKISFDLTFPSSSTYQGRTLSLIASITKVYKGQSDKSGGTIIEKGDTVIFDFTGRRNGEKFKGGTAKKYSLEIGSDSFIDGFEDQMIGLKTGETKILSLTFPEDYQQEDLAGQDVEFTVYVRHIIKQSLLGGANLQYSKS